MPAPKPPHKIYLSVDGFDEKFYFEWLRDRINENQNSKRKVALVCHKCTPSQLVKRVTILDKNAKVFHVGDYEDPKTDPERFVRLLDEMRDAESFAGPKLIKFNYSLAYSNLSFELWVLLHKIDYLGTQTYITNYWPKLKSIYDLATVQSLKEYKEEGNFKNLVLDKLTLQNVRDAIERAEKIELANQENERQKLAYKRFEYYADNPSLSIHIPIKALLLECGLL